MERRLREDQEREYQAALRADEERVRLPPAAGCLWRQRTERGSG